jgi:hypothetical protein
MVVTCGHLPYTQLTIYHRLFIINDGIRFGPDLERIEVTQKHSWLLITFGDPLLRRFNMIKALYFLLTLLLAPGLALAADPSANLSVTVAPASTTNSGNCNPNNPPPGALAAGFTTLAFCEDFSQPKYATLSNWLDPTGNSAGQFEQTCTDNPGNICGTGGVSQGTDPATGKTVMHVHWDGNSNCVQGPYGADCTLVWATTNGNCSTASDTSGVCTGLNGGIDFPMSFYTEIRERQTPNLNGQGNLTPQNTYTPVDYFMWLSQNPKINGVPGHGFMEQDIVEEQNGTTIHSSDRQWGISCAGNGAFASWWPLDITQQHTIGWLSTADTSQQVIEESLWLDGTDNFNRGTPNGTNPQTLGPTGCYNTMGHTRMEIGTWFGGVGAANGQSWPGMVIDYYVEYIALWTCANWRTDNVCATGLKP